MRPLPGHAKRVKALAGKTHKLLQAAAKDVIPKIVTWTMHRMKKLAKASGEDPQVPVDIDWNPFRDLYQAALNAQSADVVTQAAGDLDVNDSELDALIEEANAAAKASADQRSAEMIGMKVDADGDLVTDEAADMAISDSTRNMIATDVQEALSQGMDADQLSQVLQENYAFSEARANVIAETELNNATTNATLSVWDSAGIAGKEWVLSDSHVDEDECDDCADQGPIPISDTFVTGDMGPTAHPNCHCSLKAVFILPDES